MTPTYAKQLAEHANRIETLVKQLAEQEKHRDHLNSPTCNTSIWLGFHAQLYKNGKPNPATEQIRLAWLKTLDDEIIKTKSRIEGARFQIIQIAKEAIQ